MYFNINLNFSKFNKKAHLLVSEQYIFPSYLMAHHQSRPNIRRSSVETASRHTEIEFRKLLRQMQEAKTNSRLSHHVYYFRKSCHGGRDATFFSLVGFGDTLEIAAHVLVQWVSRGVVRGRSEYQRCFAKSMIDITGRVY